MTTAPTILILDGEQRAALAVTRALGSKGCRVHIGSAARRPLAGASRYSLSESLLPSPLSNSRKYSTAVGALARAIRADILLPISEASALAVLRHREVIGNVKLPFVDITTFERACDKAAVLSLAEGLGISVPRQWAVDPANGLEPSIPPEAFPIVLKPTRSLVGPSDAKRKTGVQYAATPEQLPAVLHQFGEDSGPLLAQCEVRGPGIGVFMLRWEGSILASFAHRRLREKPPSGGVSVLSESTVLPPHLERHCAALLEALDWKGVAMIEFKHDDRTGIDVLMEINPRFWGSLQLAIDSGVDFPWLLVQLALDRPTTPSGSWASGQRLRWWLGDLDHLISRINHPSLARHLPPGTPGLIATALAVFSPLHQGQRNEICRLNDPRPAIREACHWVMGR